MGKPESKKNKTRNKTTKKTRNLLGKAWPSVRASAGHSSLWDRNPAGLGSTKLSCVSAPPPVPGITGSGCSQQGGGVREGDREGAWEERGGGELRGGRKEKRAPGHLAQCPLLPSPHTLARGPPSCERSPRGRRRGGLGHRQQPGEGKPGG